MKRTPEIKQRLLFPFTREQEPRNNAGQDNVSLLVIPTPLPLSPSWLFINRDFFCYSIADSIDDLSHAASLCNYAGECTTRNKIAEKSIRNATTRTASKIASSDTGENNQRRVISRFCPQAGGRGGRQVEGERPTTRVIDCGTHALRGRHLSFFRAIKLLDTYIVYTYPSEMQFLSGCILQKFQPSPPEIDTKLSQPSNRKFNYYHLLSNMINREEISKEEAKRAGRQPRANPNTNASLRGSN